MISIGTSLNNRNRQIIHDNFGIQLPLIEMHQSRVNNFVLFLVSTLSIFKIFLFSFFSHHQEILYQEKQQNHLVFYLLDVDEILS